MTNPDYRALCAELVNELEEWIVCDDEAEIVDVHALIDRVRIALAQPVPVPVPVAPTDKELMDLAEEVWVPFAKSQPHPQGHPWDLVLARAVLDRWGQP